MHHDSVLKQLTYLVMPCHACEFGSRMTLAQSLAQKVDISWSDAMRDPHPALSLVGYKPPKRPPKKLKERKPYNTQKTQIGPGWARKWHELENAWGRILLLRQQMRPPEKAGRGCIHLLVICVANRAPGNYDNIPTGLDVSHA